MLYFIFLLIGFILCYSACVASKRSCCDFEEVVEEQLSSEKPKEIVHEGV